MQLFAFRPTFEIQLIDSQQDAIEKIDHAYKLFGDRKLLLIFGEYGELHLPSSEHRVWTPHLFFSVYPKGERSFILGRFAPRLEIWTFVWICYMTFAFSAFFGFILGFSQFMIGSNAWGTWIGVAALLLWGTLVIVAHVGQQLSSDQMHSLQAQLNEFLNQAQLQIED
jgi:TM2 domain-containing membrane protein YozV